MNQAIKLERALTELREQIAALRESIRGLDSEIKPGAVYTVARLAALLERSEMTVYRAVKGGFLKMAGGRILGRDALAWVEAGLPTGKNKGDVKIQKKGASV